MSSMGSRGLERRENGTEENDIEKKLRKELEQSYEIGKRLSDLIN